MKLIIVLIIPTLIFLGAFTAVSMPGGYSEVPVTDKNVIDAANFAVEAKAKDVQEEKKTVQVELKLLKIISAQQQVVSGMNYKLKLEVSFDGQEKMADAVVWWQDWRKPEPYILTSWTWSE